MQTWQVNRALCSGFQLWKSHTANQGMKRGRGGEKMSTCEIWTGSEIQLTWLGQRQIFRPGYFGKKLLGLSRVICYYFLGFACSLCQLCSLTTALSLNHFLLHICPLSLDPCVSHIYVYICSLRLSQSDLHSASDGMGRVRVPVTAVLLGAHYFLSTH